MSGKGPWERRAAELRGRDGVCSGGWVGDVKGLTGVPQSLTPRVTVRGDGTVAVGHSVVSDSVTAWTAALPAPPWSAISQSLPTLMSTVSVMPGAVRR